MVELSPSALAPVCQAGDQLELTCTSSGTVHRLEFTVSSEGVTHTTVPITSEGTSGVTSRLTFSNSMITLSRLSAQDSSPLVSRSVFSPVSSGLNGTVVKCFEGISSTDSVATTIIRIIDSQQFGKTPHSWKGYVYWVHRQSMAYSLTKPMPMHTDVVCNFSHINLVCQPPW